MEKKKKKSLDLDNCFAFLFKTLRKKNFFLSSGKKERERALRGLPTLGVKEIRYVQYIYM